ncbi:hypothetical protein ACN4EE_17360 [Geminocystis sp. CENA526]|uniref:hypothetical protein n=1 Tax=Geminocystis sp. CENA526 TaxID=1355871 RepID=UPI003D6E7A6D
MKVGEIMRIIIFTLVGFVIMMWLQPLLYRQNFFGVIRSIPLQDWIQQYYLAAWIIFGFSVTFTVLWCVILLKNQNGNASTYKLLWYIGLFLLVVIVSITVYFNNQDKNGELIQETLLSMIGLFWFNSLFLLYWLPTVTSTPGLLKRRTVPLAILINDLMGRN